MGVYANNDITIDEISNVLVGFVEYIDQKMFETWDILGYDSLYQFIDHSTKIPQERRCILFGPLSLVNASAKRIKVGFTNTNPDNNDKQLYSEFVYSFKAFYKQNNSKRMKHYKSTIEADDFDAATRSVYKNNIKTKWNKHRLPFWPAVKSSSERKIIPRVDISWYGREGDHTNETRTVRQDNEILINYPWIKKKVFYKSTV